MEIAFTPVQAGFTFPLDFLSTLELGQLKKPMIY